MQPDGYSGACRSVNCSWWTSRFGRLSSKKCPQSALEELATKQGMLTLWQNGLQRAMSGETTLDEDHPWLLAADMM